jgi:GNAT superfamily N-acetyltransferase
VKTQVNVILARHVPAEARDLKSQISNLRSEIPLQHVTRTSDPAFAAMDRLYTDARFPPDWSASTLAAGDQALVLVDPATAHALAAAWIARRAFYVQEIRRTFDPGPTADYYFGDFVSPAARGRGLQRLLISHRLDLSRGRTALAMTCPANHPSQANYASLGFIPVATLTSRSLAGLQFDRCSPAFPKYLSREGLPLPRHTRLRLG